MRARGANVTDIVVLVVAVDDGVMPRDEGGHQAGKEAEVAHRRRHQQDGQRGVNTDRVKKELADNNLLAEDWGGDTSWCLSRRRRRRARPAAQNIALQPRCSS